MIVTKCDRCRKVMDTPAYAQMLLPFVLPNTEVKKPVIPKYMIIRCEPNEGQDNLNLCPDCERDLDAFFDNPPLRENAPGISYVIHSRGNVNDN